MNTKATTKTLTDVAAESARRVQAITGAPGEPAASCCDAVSPGNGYRCFLERGHITEHVAMTIDWEVCDTWPVEIDDKPEPAPSPSKPPHGGGLRQERLRAARGRADRGAGPGVPRD